LDDPQTELPSKIVPRNRLIMMRYLEGQQIEAIAEIYGLQVSTVRQILNSPLVKQEMTKIAETVGTRIANLSDEAIDLVRDTMRGQNNSELRFKAANSLLDRNPELKPKSDIQSMAEGLGEGLIRALGKQIRESEKQAIVPDLEVIADENSGSNPTG
jgi:transposase